MKTKMGWLAVVLLLAGVPAARASSPCGIYARIDEVTLAPDETQPTSILIHGDFLVVMVTGRQMAPMRGYLCFSLESAERNGPGGDRGPVTGRIRERCLIEWEDLKKLADDHRNGTAYVAFGSAFSEKFRGYPTIRNTADLARQNPFPYPIHHGLTKLRTPADQRESARPDEGNRNPVLVLQEYRVAKDKETRTGKDAAAP